MTHEPNQPESAPAPGDCSELGRSLLALTMVPGLGPIRIAQLIESLGSGQAVLGASVARLAQIRGIGSATATKVVEHLHLAIGRIDEELEKISKYGAHVVAMGDSRYPELLAQIPSAPPILMIRGRFDHLGLNRYTVSIVGWRACSIYGSEQATRFAGSFGSAGLTVVSGGARGIDSAAHRGSLSVNAPTVVVLGCGIGRVYPPENAGLFDEIVERGGAIISELPVHAHPDSVNFPGRNRIISGISLGVVVIEAGLKSGSLITARMAIEDHGREVMGVPGRVDSPASAGTLELLKSGAHLVSEPSDVIAILERDAYHLHAGSHGPKTIDPSKTPDPGGAIFAQDPQPTAREPDPIGEVDEPTRRLLGALDEPRTGDELADLMGVDPGQIRAMLTMLEIQGRVRRVGSRFERVR